MNDGIDENLLGEAVEQYLKSAERGDARSQRAVAGLYRYGVGVKQDYAEALKWYLAAANRGNVFAQFELADMYLNAKNPIRSNVNAYIWYSVAAESGHKEAKERMVSLSSSLPPEELAEGNLKAAGLKPEARSRHASEGAYYSKDPRDSVIALAITRAAAQEGNARSQCLLGDMYEQKDAAEALKWWRKAASQGYSLAYYRIGNLYAEGRGVSQDYQEAYFWFLLADAAGYDIARAMADKAAAKLHRTERAYAEALAARWKPIAAQETPHEESTTHLHMLTGVLIGSLIGILILVLVFGISGDEAFTILLLRLIGHLLP